MASLTIPDDHVEPLTAVWENFPPELDGMADAIRLSRGITETEDEDGRSLCSEGTWQRAMNFLARQALWLLTERGRVMPTPDIWAGPDQSIDLHWEASTHELLINIRSDPAQPAGFYGDDKGKLKIKGTLDPSAFNEGLLLWLENRGDRLA